MEGPPIASKEKVPERIPFENFPWGTLGLKEYEQSQDDPQRIDAVRDILETFLNLEVQRLGMFQSAEQGVSFPYTSINLKELAETLFKKYGGKTSSTYVPHQENTETAPRREQVEFVFGSILGTQDAGPFDFCDENLHRIMMALPRALAALQEGEEMEDLTVYTLSSPIHELGTMTPQFFERFQQDPFQSLGDVYAESVQKLALEKQPENAELSINFTGFSMGASFAGKTAENLLSKESLTQSREVAQTGHIPYLSLTAYEPAGRNESPFRLLQVPLGFVAETGYQVATNPALKEILKTRAAFSESLRNVMAAQGFKAHTDDEQAAYKKKASGLLGPLVKKLIAGVPMDESIKSNEIIGTRDPTLFSPSRYRQALEKRNQPHSLGSPMTERTHENRRVFGNVQMSHTIPFFSRKNEMQRWDRAAEAVLALQEK